MFFINKTIEYGLYLLVFLLPIQTRWIIKAGASEYGTISLYGTDILLVILVALFVVHKVYSRKLRVASCELRVYWWLILGLDLAIFISIFFAEDKLIAIYKYAVFLLGIGLFWLIVSANYNKIKLIYCFLAGIFLQACLGIWQFLTQSSFACKWLGMAEHDASVLGTSVIETISSIDGIGERWLRAYGGMDHPNILGGILAIGILLAVGLLVKFSKSKDEISDIRYQILDFKNIKYLISNIQYLFLASYFLLLTSLFFTFSRGAWLGLAVGVFIMLALMVVKKDLLGQKKLLQIILMSSVLIFILFSQFQDLVSTRLSNSARLEVKSNVERIESYKDSWEMIKGNWLFGVGVGNYTKYNANLQINANAANTNYANKCQSTNCEYVQPVHNVFLLVWAEIGIIGLLFFIALLLRVASCELRVMRYALCVVNCESRVASCALLIAMIIMFTIDHWWWSLHFGIFLFWMILGLAIRESAGKRAIADNK